MSPTQLTMRQVCTASGFSRYQLEQWISRGYFEPAMKPANGKARLFSIEEAVRLAAMAELNRLGLPPKAANSACQYIHRFIEGDAILVVWQGPGALLQSVSRGAPTPESNKEHYHERGFPIIHPAATRMYNPDSPAIFSHVVRPADLPDLVADPDKRSILLVNLNKVEERIKAVAINDEPA